jgi:hypothetical protein
VDDQLKQPLPINTDAWRAFMIQYQMRQRKKRGLSQPRLFITESSLQLITENGQSLATEN